MLDLLKYTYLLDNKNAGKRIEWLWKRYQKILDNKNSSWKDLNEARVILYFLGYLYPEKIALNSIASRVKYIQPKIDLDRFLGAVDSHDRKILKKYHKNNKFNKLKTFYLIVKNIKNRTKNGSYLDEKRFNQRYSAKKPKNYF
jgi:hypothetical protein